MKVQIESTRLMVLHRESVFTCLSCTQGQLRHVNTLSRCNTIKRVLSICTLHVLAVHKDAISNRSSFTWANTTPKMKRASWIRPFLDNCQEACYIRVTLQVFI